jgi:hypothetical protein
LTGTATISSSERSTRLDNHGIVVRVPAGNFLPLPNARRPLGHNKPLFQYALAGSATGAKLTALVLRQSVVWSNTYTALRLHDLYRDNLTITCTTKVCAVHKDGLLVTLRLGMDDTHAAWPLDTLLQNLLSTVNNKLLDCMQVCVCVCVCMCVLACREIYGQTNSANGGAWW